MRSTKAIVTALAAVILLGTAVGAEDYVEGEVIVKFNDEITLEFDGQSYSTGLPAIDGINEAIGVSYIEQVTPLPDEWTDDPTGYFTWGKYLTAYEDHGLGRIYYVEFDSEEATVAYVVNQYENTGLVEYAEPNYFVEPCEVVPDDEYYDDQWYLDDDAAGAVRANRGWVWETGDPDIRVGVLDSGISMCHPDLKDKIIWPRDCIEQDDRPLDYAGHGTGVAGIIAAETNNDYDFDPTRVKALGIAGTSWGSLIVPIKVMNGGDDFVLYFNRGINWAITHHARVINMSLAFVDDEGGPAEPGSARDHCNAAWQAGHLLIAAAGNEGTDEMYYPAGWAVVMAVSAIDYDAVIVRDPPWGWASSYGNHIELCAPGIHIKTTKEPPHYNWDPEEHGGWPWGYEFYNLYTEYTAFNGTSAAAPIVSGVAALKWAQCPNWTNQQIRDYLNKSAWDIGGDGHDIYYGHGRVDALRALGLWSEPVETAPGTSGGPDTIASSLTVSDGYYHVRPYEVYPNPASGELNLNVPSSSGVTRVNIYDISGRLVFSSEAPADGATITWDLCDREGTRASSGVYVVKYEGADEPVVKKVVVR